MRVLVFGDSITQGFFDIEQGGWVNRIARHYEAEALKDLHGDWIEVFNLGISGDTVAGVAERLTSETEARRYEEGTEFAFVISIGMNDVVSRGQEFDSSPKEYAGNIKTIIQKAREFSQKILFVGLTAVDEKQTNPWRYSSSGKRWANDRIREFDTKLQDICNLEKLPIARVYEKFQEEMTKSDLLADGLHPNAKGHELIASLVQPELEKLLR